VLGQAIAARLKAEVEASSLSQRQFAPIVGISSSQLSKILRGEAFITVELLDIICHELGLSLVEVLDKADFETRARWDRPSSP